MFRSELKKRQREDSNLDSVFNRLQVSTISKEGITGNLPASINGHIPLNDHDVRLNQAIGRKLTLKRRKKANKSVIKKAKLILPKNFSPNRNQGTGASRKNDADLGTDEDGANDADFTVGEDEVFLNGTIDTSVSSAPVSCSTQYLQQGTNGQPSGDPIDSSPDELASYFEQILFIPKPMSLMAQMMYA